LQVSPPESCEKPLPMFILWPISSVGRGIRCREWQEGAGASRGSGRDCARGRDERKEEGGRRTRREKMEERRTILMGPGTMSVVTRKPLMGKGILHDETPSQHSRPCHRQPTCKTPTDLCFLVPPSSPQQRPQAMPSTATSENPRLETWTLPGQRPNAIARCDPPLILRPHEPA
jgi:hypothetical protein